MAESLVEFAVEKLASEIIKKFGLMLGVKRDLGILENTFRTIKDVLEDAESRSLKEKPLSNWLARLKDATYDVEDLLDYIQMETERRNLEIHGDMIKKVRYFFSRSNPIIFRFKISHRVKEMRERLDEISTESSKFHLEKRDAKDMKVEVVEGRETWSTPDERNICGRDGDIEKIVSILLETNNEEDVLILPIVGMGGLGKTTLAQLVYNDERVKRKEQFEPRSWVYVSTVFDLKKIGRDAISSFTGQNCNLDNLDSIGNQLKERLREKRFLLVLDDVWNEDEDVWEKLKPMFNVGRRGSRIIVTTRSEKIASMMGNLTPYHLKGLSNDDCWKLFKQRAFDKENDEENSRLVEIGKEIVKKCGGVPLAAKTLGSIMRFKKKEDEWLAVRDNDILKLTEDENKVLASLKLSYTHLPPPVKQCFAYCSLFPKGYEFDKDILISQWIAQGFVRSVDGSLPLEIIADTYFNDLLWMSFLQISDDDIYSGEVTYKMHDLVHDLSRIVAGDDVFVEEAEKAMAGLAKGRRYVTLMGNIAPTKVSTHSLKKVRALHVFDNSEEFPGSILSSAKCLRTLDLSDFGRIKSLPKLSNLRYLCASIRNIEMLPEHICGLRNLQCLYLSDCGSLRTLPESIGDLCKLRNLKLTGCGSELQQFPDSFGNLEHLLSLDLSGARMELLPIKSFGRLQNLQCINLFYCRSLKELPDSIGGLQNLQSINLSQCGSLKELPDSIGDAKNLRSINLEVCESLKELPDSIGGLQNLQSINLSQCGSLKELPDSIGDAKNLRSLKMLLCVVLLALPESMSNLTRLESLNLDGCRQLQELPKGLGNVRNLKHLRIEECWSLRGMPRDMRQLTNLVTLPRFVVGKQEDGFSSIGELERLNHIEGELEIRNLERVRNTTDAMKANLKEKRKLYTLGLAWRLPKGVDDVGVLECLQPPPSIKTLRIDGYRGTKIPSWLASSASLPNLASLTLMCMERIDRLPAVLLPSLTELVFDGNDNLEEWATEEAATLFPCLKKLTIWGCPKLKARPCIPASVEELIIKYSNSEELLSDRSLRSCSRLRILEICGVSSANLQWMELQHLASSLQKLSIYNSNELKCLPESVCHLASLRSLTLSNCEKLSEIGEWVGELQSLRSLSIRYCPSLTSLPNGLAHLALDVLSISGCPGLKERCKREIGEDWHIISHIPHIYI